ncbi:MAG: amine dehydrogenase large subunit [Acetobacter sp.]|jgi:methylamine dehydrogenase heavy chain
MKATKAGAFVTCLLVGAALIGGSSHGHAEEPVLQTEQSDTLTLPPAGPHRVLVQDAVYEHAKDGRIYVVDADNARLMGMVQAAYNANMAGNPAAKAFYVAETAWSHGNRGTKADILATYDSRSLAIVNDEELPGRALVTPKAHNLQISADGKKIFVYDMTPGNAVHIIDANTHKVETSVDIAGCSLIYPWKDANGQSGFSSICGNGGLVNVTLKANAVPTLTHTAPFFSPDIDPVFENSPEAAADGQAWFISYSGLVWPVALGPDSTVGTPFSLQKLAGQKPGSDAKNPFDVAWRPGGWQLAAFHRKTGHLFVLMHRGTFWTHKAHGQEIWEVDVRKPALIRRIPVPAPTSLVGITQDAEPLIFTSDDQGDFFILDAKTGHLRHKMPHLGSSLIYTLSSGE